MQRLSEFYDAACLISVWLVLIVVLPLEFASVAIEQIDMADNFVVGVQDSVEYGNNALRSSKLTYLILAQYGLVRYRQILMVLVAMPGLIRASFLGFLILSTLAFLARSGFEDAHLHGINGFRFLAFFLVLPLMFLRGIRVIPRWLALGILIASLLAVIQFGVLAVVTAQAGEAVRYSFLGGKYPNITAQHFLTIACSALMFLVGWRPMSRFSSAILMGVIVLCCVMIFLSGSRGVMAAMFVAASLWLAMSFVRRPARWLPACALGCAAIGFLLFTSEELFDILPSESLSQFQRKGFSDDVSTGRFDLWSHYSSELLDQSQFLLYGMPYGLDARRVGDPHSLYIGLIIEHGFPAAAFLVIFVFAILAHGFRLAMTSSNPLWQAAFYTLSVTIIQQSVENNFHLNVDVFVWNWYVVAGCLTYTLIQQRYPRFLEGEPSSRPLQA